MVSIVKRNTYYYFRLWIPTDLRHHFGCKEIWKSLKTESYHQAKTLVKPLQYKSELIFMQIRSGMLSRDQVKVLVKEYLHTTLNRCEDLRAIGLVLYDAGDGATSRPGVENGQKIASSIVACESLIVDTQSKLASNDFGSVHGRVDRFLHEKGIEPDRDSSVYVTLCREILKAEIETLKIEVERLKGNYDNKYDNFLDANLGTSVAGLPAPMLPVVVEQGPLLSKIIEENVKEAVLGGNWTEKTQAENESIYRWLLEILGDREMKTITHQDLITFRDKLAKMPANREKKPAYKGKSVDQILAMRRVVPITVSTLNKYLVRVSSLFKWAAKHQYISVNISEGLTLPKTKRADDERGVYEKEDIQTILDNLVADEKKPENFWIPLFGLYTGMRLDEICQLYLSDIVTIDGIPCIDVNDKDDKKLKSLASTRIVPIHPVLLKLGFLRFVESVRKQNKKRLWANLNKKRDGYSQDFGKWYQRFNRRCITNDPKKVFHSFRHTLTNNLKQNGVQEVTIAEIVGHANESMTMSRYGKRYEPKVLLDALKKLDYGITIPKG